MHNQVNSEPTLPQTDQQEEKSDRCSSNQIISVHYTNMKIALCPPSIHLVVSPFLTIPSIALAKVAEYLVGYYVDTEQLICNLNIQNLMGTCRHLHTEMNSAIDFLRNIQDAHVNNKAASREDHSYNAAIESEGEPKDFPAKLHDGQKDKNLHNHELECVTSVEKSHASSVKKRRGNMCSEIRSSRSSKRVRSQLITSGKQAERMYKRKSVEYCLLSVVLNCTTHNPLYSKIVSKHFEWNRLLSLHHGSRNNNHMVLKPQNPDCRSISDITKSESTVGFDKLSSSALIREFIQKWNLFNTGPHNYLLKFLAYVSCHTCEVFHSEGSGTSMLCSCLLECFDTISCKDTQSGGLCSLWLGNLNSYNLFTDTDGPHDRSNLHSFCRSLEAFAMNLLHAELRMRKCEGLGLQANQIDEEISFIEYMIPILLKLCKTLENWFETLTDFTSVANDLKDQLKVATNLCVRTHWLVTNFNVWWSRHCHSASLDKQHILGARNAETHALEHIDIALAILSKAIILRLNENETSEFTVLTPHLESPTRSEHHWRQLSTTSLSLYRDELESSSVVFYSRRDFDSFRTRYLKCRDDGELGIICAESSECTQEKGLDPSTKDNTGLSFYALSDKEKKELLVLGKRLLSRYGLNLTLCTLKSDSTACSLQYVCQCTRFEELIDDFINLHGDQLFIDFDTNNQSEDKNYNIDDNSASELPSELVAFKENSMISSCRWKRVWTIIPSSPLSIPKCLCSSEFSNPSLLTIIVTIIQQSGNNNRVMLVSFLSSLITTILERRRNILLSREIEGSETYFLDENERSDREKNDIKVPLETIDVGLTETYLCMAKFLIAKLGDISSGLICNTWDDSYHQENASQLEFLQTLMMLVQTVLHMSSGCLNDKDEHLRYKQSDEGVEIRYSLPNKDLLQSILTLVSVLMKAFEIMELYCKKKKLLSCIFTSMAKLIVHIRNLFPILLQSMRGNQHRGRNAQKNTCTLYADYVALLSSEVAALLSENPSIYDFQTGSIQECFLMKELVIISPKFLDSESNHKNSACFKGLDITPLAKLSESFLWFQKNCLNCNLNNSASGSIYSKVSKRLMVPVSAAIVTLCTSTGYDANISHTITRNLMKRILDNQQQEELDRSHSLSDYFSTDASAEEFEYKSDHEYDTEKKSKARRDLLHKLCKSVQCIGLIFSHLDDKVAADLVETTLTQQTINVPFLPLLVARSLTCISDFVLSYFHESHDDDCSKVVPPNIKGIWACEYPFGFRSTGVQLDAILCKAYRILHGINLLTYSSNDLTIPSTTSSQLETSIKRTWSIKPESKRAAVRLYRCILRAYGNSRRCPPKDALECVASALPRSVENKSSIAIRKFIFSVPSVKITDLFAKNQSNLLEDSYAYIDYLPPDFPEWVLEENINTSVNEFDGDILPLGKESGDKIKSNKFMQTKFGDDGCQEGNCHDKDEIFIVQKGICEELAEGPLPEPGGTVTTDNFSENNMNEERESTAQTEIKLKKKIQAIIDALCYDPMNCKRWFQLGLCFGTKADIINDRINMPLTSKKNDFYVPHDQDSLEQRQKTCFSKDALKQKIFLPISDLFNYQYHEYIRGAPQRFEFVGSDLSCYMDIPWANFLALSSFSIKKGDALRANLNEADYTTISSSEQLEISKWDLIHSKYEKGKFDEWQQSWGSIFVTSLKSMCKRCLQVAMFLCKKNHKSKSDSDHLYPEIAEALGTEYYCDLMSSTSHGYRYPINAPLTEYECRIIAYFAKACFERAIKYAKYSHNLGFDESIEIWDLYFMVGKCEEKISSTLFDEQFSGQLNNDFTEVDKSFIIKNNFTRQYESLMDCALKSYSQGLREVQANEGKGNSNNRTVGASAHGSLEFIYRLHASRFKVLLNAVKLPHHVRKLGEEEALRISERYWFEQPSFDEAVLKSMGIRDRIWLVLADVVAAMAYCRREEPFFHRSVYRHAQALLWAPIFDDPDGYLKEGSLAIISAAKSYKLRGLNSGSCANSAEAIMNMLFDKKRDQLCGVWIATPSSPSPFQVLNDATSKFDSIRYKYIRAYVDCMRLCQRREKLETFMSWCCLSSRDLPSFYNSSAYSKGGIPNNLHTDESLLEGSGLLWSTMRYTNHSIAIIIKNQLAELRGNESESVFKNDPKELLKSALLCYLRLNCPLDSAFWHSQRIKLKLSDGTIDEVESFCDAFKNFCNFSTLGSSKNFQIPSEHRWLQKMTILNIGITQCEFLFPNISIRRNTRKRKKQKFASKDIKESLNRQHILEKGDSSLKESNTKKNMQKDDKSKISEENHRENITKSVVVLVPKGLDKGDRFEVIVTYGNYTKRINLVKPEGNHKKMKFKLKVPLMKSATLSVKTMNVT